MLLGGEWRKLFAQLSRTSFAVSSFLKELCYHPSNPHRVYLSRVYDGILGPCLANHSHYVQNTGGGVRTVQIPFHEYQDMEISDYFSGLGYVFTHLSPPFPTVTFTELIQLLSQYAEWCRLSSTVLNVNTPTVVQILFDAPHSTNAKYGFNNAGVSVGRFSLASSVSAGKGNGREDVREARIETLESVWPHPLLYPTPVQRAHAHAGIGFGFGRGSVSPSKGNSGYCSQMFEPTAELFGTPWGHCGEGVSFPSLYNSIQRGRPLGTLALSVKAMNSAIPGTDTIPVHAIQSLTSLHDIVELLRVSGAMRSMCLNCLFLRDNARGVIEDYAVKFSSPNVEPCATY